MYSHVNLFATFGKRKTRTNIPFVECHMSDIWYPQMHGI